MALHIETTGIGSDIAVVTVSGELTVEESATFTVFVQTLLERGEKKLILDLGGVSQIDSIGGMALVRSYFAARETGASLCVSCASPCVTRLFSAAGVDTLIPFCPTTAAAVKHLTTPPNAEGE